MSNHSFKGGENIRQIHLTFDVEDFIGANSIDALFSVLRILEKNKLRGLFFITGHMAEKIADFPSILSLLNSHEIGYHSSSHSVRPAIFEFTDIEDYDKAYEISLQRETSHINPITGLIESQGGITALRALFPEKKIVAYRGPGLFWSPPHLEALRDLGLKLDFSTNISKTPVNHKGITFYPFPLFSQWSGNTSQILTLMLRLFRFKNSVLLCHPNLLADEEFWDSIYWKGNPEALTQPLPKKPVEIWYSFFRFSCSARLIRLLKSTKLATTETQLTEARTPLRISRASVENWYQQSINWPKLIFNYEPRFLRKHFLRFFGID